MKLRLLLAVALVGSSLLVFPEAVAANHTATCQSPANWRAFIGRTHNPTGNVTGARADIDIGGWGLCTGADYPDFLFFFVDIGAQNSGCQVASSCLVQFGIVWDPDNGVQYAWAYGGCAGKSADIDVLGSATTSSHNFRIELDAGGVFRFFRDGGQLGISVSKNDPAVSCWANGDRGVDWLMEKSDYGNGFGEVASKSQFDTVVYRISSWISPPSSSLCYDGAGNDICTDYFDGDFDGWTDNGGTFAAQSMKEFVYLAPSKDWVGVPWR